VLHAAQVARIVELIDGLENLADVRELATAVRARG
jgi:hypothetical protein